MALKSCSSPTPTLKAPLPVWRSRAVLRLAIPIKKKTNPCLSCVCERFRAGGMKDVLRFPLGNTHRERTHRLFGGYLLPQQCRQRQIIWGQGGSHVRRSGPERTKAVDSNSSCRVWESFVMLIHSCCQKMKHHRWLGRRPRLWLLQLLCILCT